MVLTTILILCQKSKLKWKSGFRDLRGSKALSAALWTLVSGLQENPHCSLQSTSQHCHSSCWTLILTRGSGVTAWMACSGLTGVAVTRGFGKYLSLLCSKVESKEAAAFFIDMCRHVNPLSTLSLYRHICPLSTLSLYRHISPLSTLSLRRHV